LLERVLARSPDDYDVLRALAQGHLSAGGTQQALEYANRCCAVRPDEPEPFKLRMKVWQRLDKPTEALGDGMRALLLDAEDDAFRLEMAYWLRGVERLSLAEEFCRRLLKKQPGDPALRLFLAE